jgi:hypothetical protein
VTNDAEDRSEYWILPGWGVGHDPHGDCRLELESSSRLRIHIPPTLHDLGTEIGVMNAPRVLEQVVGDFVAEVHVASGINPAGECTRAGAVPFQGAGLLLWWDDENYVRVERSAVIRREPDSAPTSHPYFAFEKREAKEPSSAGYGLRSEAPLSIRLERRGERLVASASLDKQTWHAIPPVSITGWPHWLKIGVAAVNTATVPMDVVLENYRLRLLG